MNPHKDLLTAIEAHLKALGITATAFGRKVARDPNLVFDLRNGRSPSLRLVGLIHDELRAGRPFAESPAEPRAEVAA